MLSGCPVFRECISSLIEKLHKLFLENNSSVRKGRKFPRNIQPYKKSLLFLINRFLNLMTLGCKPAQGNGFLTRRDVIIAYRYAIILNPQVAYFRSFLIFHPFGVGYCVVLFSISMSSLRDSFRVPIMPFQGVIRHGQPERETPWQGVSTALPAVKLFWQVARFRQTGSLRYFFLCALCCEYIVGFRFCSTQPYVAEISTGYHKSFVSSWLCGFV